MSLAQALGKPALPGLLPDEDNDTFVMRRAAWKSWTAASKGSTRKPDNRLSNTRLVRCRPLSAIPYSIVATTTAARRITSAGTPSRRSASPGRCLLIAIRMFVAKRKCMSPIQVDIIERLFDDLRQFETAQLRRGTGLGGGDIRLITFITEPAG